MILIKGLFVNNKNYDEDFLNVSNMWSICLLSVPYLDDIPVYVRAVFLFKWLRVGVIKDNILTNICKPIVEISVWVCIFHRHNFTTSGLQSVKCYYRLSADKSPTKFQNINVSLLVFQLSLPNPLMTGRAWRYGWNNAKLLQLRLSDQQFYF